MPTPPKSNNAQSAVMSLSPRHRWDLHLINTQQNSLYTVPSSCLRHAFKPFWKESNPTPHPHPARRNVVRQTPRFALPARTTWRGPKQGGIFQIIRVPQSYSFTHLRCLLAFLFEVRSCGGGPEDKHLFEINKRVALYSARHKPGQIKVGKRGRRARVYRMRGLEVGVGARLRRKWCSSRWRRIRRLTCQNIRRR